VATSLLSHLIISYVVILWQQQLYIFPSMALKYETKYNKCI
jgi:hypothetical protein